MNDLERGAEQKLFVRMAGAGPPLVLLHGLASSSRYWEPHFEALSGAYRLIAPDLLGFGRSPKPRNAAYSPEQHVAALLSALDRLLDGPITLVGHSMGAILALHLAAARPRFVERLLLISLPVLGSIPWAHGSHDRERRFHQFSVHTSLGRALFGSGMAAVRPLGAVINVRLRPELPAGVARDALLMTWEAYWQSLENVVYGSDVAELFAGAPAPLLLLHGRLDRVAPFQRVEALARIRTDADLTEIADAGHDLACTHAAEFRTLMLDLGVTRPRSLLAT